MVVLEAIFIESNKIIYARILSLFQALILFADVEVILKV